ncbi:MAG: histidine phosphatase family protein [Ruminococcaceae bacterium]|nr:histidine phosphatase family protein [Oscillospiraceae bacterium]
MSKTIYLFRHSKPFRPCALQTEQIPLSPEGKQLIKKFLSDGFDGVKAVYSSSYLRAKETAAFFNKPVTEDSRLIERRIGDPEGFTKEIWVGQYTDFDLKNSGGESFSEVNRRMTEAVNDILNKTKDGEEAAVVFHAAAICAYLMNYCEIKVIEAESKSREISFNGKAVLSGSIACPSCFKLMFEEKLADVSYLCL